MKREDIAMKYQVVADEKILCIWGKADGAQWDILLGRHLTPALIGRHVDDLDGAGVVRDEQLGLARAS